MFFIPIEIRKHDCTPIKVDKLFLKEVLIHSMDKAGYDIYEEKYEMAICPVCDKEFHYNLLSTNIIGFKGYK